MAINDNKILSWTNPIVNESDRPQRTASEMKAVFDSNSNQLRQAVNGLIDDLAAPEAASDLGATAPDGYNGETVQEVINSVAGHASIVKTTEEKSRFLNGTGEYSVPEVGEAANGIPSGGTDGQVLVKNGSNDYEAKWGDVQALPSGGTDGQVLLKDGDVDGAAKWGSPLPSGGTDGQVLLKDGAEEGAAKWGDVQALPSGGTDGQVLVKTGETEGAASWQTLYTYGTEDLEAGVSELATGKLHFVYE